MIDYEAYRHAFPLPWLEHYVQGAGPSRPDLWFFPPYLVLNFIIDILFWIGLAAAGTLLPSRVHTRKFKSQRK